MSEAHNHYTNGMSTEMLMRHVFGDKYYGLAGTYQNPKYFKRDIRKLIKKLRKDVDGLIAGDHFKQSCDLYLERIEKSILSAHTEDDYRQLLVYSLDIITILLSVLSRRNWS